MDRFQIDDEYELILNNETTHWDTYFNGVRLSKTANQLYKYYSLNINNVDALLNHYFYLSDPGNFNDPFDCNVNLIENHGLERVPSVKRNTYRDIAITSFSETIDNHLMWAHYTSNYNGFALEFDGAHIGVYFDNETLKRQTLTRVVYPKRQPQISKEYLFAQHYVFTTKMNHWAYEKEWRIVAEVQPGNENNRCLQYDAECLKGIYIGHRVPDTNKSAYRLLLSVTEIKFPKVPIYVVHPHQTEMRLEFQKVRN